MVDNTGHHAVSYLFYSFTFTSAFYAVTINSN